MDATICIVCCLSGCNFQPCLLFERLQLSALSVVCNSLPCLLFEWMQLSALLMTCSATQQQRGLRFPLNEIKIRSSVIVLRKVSDLLLLKFNDLHATGTKHFSHYSLFRCSLLLFILFISICLFLCLSLSVSLSLVFIIAHINIQGQEIIFTLQ